MIFVFDCANSYVAPRFLFEFFGCPRLYEPVWIQTCYLDQTRKVLLYEIKKGLLNKEFFLILLFHPIVQYYKNHIEYP
jgi:hypothetical protein